MSRTPDRNHLPQMVPLDTMASIYPLYSKTTNFLFQKHNKKCPFFILLWIVLVKAPQNEKEMGEALVGEQKAKLVMDVQVVESLQAKDTQAESTGEGYTGLSFTYRTVTATYDSVFAPACR